MVNVIDLSDIGAAREDEKPKSKGIHIAVIEPGKDPYLKKIAPDADGNYTSAFQDEVGGLIEAYEPPFGETPLLWVNEEFLFNGSTPNRAIYANKRMEGIGYLSQFGDNSKPVKAGELYGILCGTFIAVGYDRDEEGNDKPRDITVEEWLDVCAAFAGIRSVLSGALEKMRRAKIGNKYAAKKRKGPKYEGNSDSEPEGRRWEDNDSREPGRGAFRQRQARFVG